MKEALFYETTTGNTVRCLLCNHVCVIEDGKTGNCRVRSNNKGKLFSSVYGYPATCNIDSIEKKPLFHFYPGSLTYSLGTFGCNLCCHNCQNHDLSQIKNIESKITNLDFMSPMRIVEEAIGNDCNSIAYSYNEPTMFTEYALDIMKLAQSNGLKNVWTSNGFMSDACLDAIIPFLDAVNIDIKSFDDYFYRDNCQAKLKPVLRNLLRLKQEQIHLELTTLVIPSLSDDINMLGELAEFIATELDTDTPWHLTKFSPDTSWKLKDFPSTGEDIIYEAYEIGKDAGLKYVYVGNIPGDQKENTYCPKCNELAIRRLGQYIERLDQNGHCIQCDRSLDITE